jgi:hypothetical protein
MSLTANEIDDIVEASKTQKKLYERRWEICLRFLNNEQHPGGYDPVTQGYSGANARGRTRHIVINLISPIYKNILSRLSTNYPGVAVMPTGASSDRILQAQSSEVYLRYCWHVNKINRVARRVVEYLLSLGTAAVQVYWEPGDKTPQVRAVNAFDLFWDAGALNHEDSDWIAVRRWATPKALKAAYPDFDYNTESEEFGTSNASARTINAQLQYTDTQPAPGKLEVFDIYSDGRHYIYCNNQVLWEDDTPFGITPVHVMIWTEVPNISWGQGMVEPLIDLQRVYNAGREMVMSNAAKMANPKWLVSTDANVAANALTANSGEKVYFDGPLPPKQAAAAPLPSYVIDNLRTIPTEMQDVSGIHSATLGRKQSGQSGKALEIQTTNDLSSIQVSQECIEDAFTGMAESMLCYAKENIREPVMVRQMGTFGRVVFQEITNLDIVDTPQVLIETGTLFQDSIQDREARVLAQFQAGLIDKDVAMKELSFRTGNSYLIQQMQEISHAKAMLKMVTQGDAMLDLSPADDVGVFMEVFSEFMREPEFYGLPQHRQDYISDLIKRQFAPMAESAPKSREDAVAQLGMAQSPVMQAQIAAGAIDSAQQQADMNVIESDAIRADGAIPEGGQ